MVKTAIVGAGPTGLFLGLALARRGHAVTIVDRDPGPTSATEWDRKGVMQFLDNVDIVCARVGVTCVHAPIPHPAPDELLSYVHDAHYSLRGHQWLADYLTQALYPLIQKNSP